MIFRLERGVEGGGRGWWYVWLLGLDILGRRENVLRITAHALEFGGLISGDLLCGGTALVEDVVEGDALT